jgi:hypothetical protein
MGPLNNFDPIFFYLKLRKSAIGKAFDGVVTPSARFIELGKTELGVKKEA